MKMSQQATESTSALIKLKHRVEAVNKLLTLNNTLLNDLISRLGLDRSPSPQINPQAGAFNSPLPVGQLHEVITALEELYRQAERTSDLINELNQL